MQRLWDNGRLLAAGITGESLSRWNCACAGRIRRALSERFDEVRRVDPRLGEREPLSDRVAEMNHRLLGRNRVPARIFVPGEREALELIGKVDDAARFRSLAQRLRGKPCRNWPDGSRRKPLIALQHESDWKRVLAVLLWFREHPRSSLYLGSSISRG